MLQYLYLTAGLILLLNGAEWLLEGAASLAKKFKIHKLVIGLTIVAFGTSLPELFVSVIASLSGKSDIIMGNLMGSNIANILLILGITASITILPLHRNTVWKEIPFSFIALTVVLLLAHKIFIGFGHNTLTIIDGIILLLLFILFLYYTSDLIANKNVGKEEKEEKLETNEEIDLAEPKYRNIWMIIGAVMVGLVALYVGGKMTVENAVLIAKSLGVSELFISATVVAIGTSLPELFVSLRAAIKRELDLAIGNIVGSNIFNTLFIIGIGAIISPITMSAYIIIDVIIAMAVTLLLFAYMFVGHKHSLNRWQGISFLILYIAYIIYALLR